MDLGTYDTLTAADYAEPEGVHPAAVSRGCDACEERHATRAFALCDFHAMRCATATTFAEHAWWTRNTYIGDPNTVRAFARLSAHFGFLILARTEAMMEGAL